MCRLPVRGSLPTPGYLPKRGAPPGFDFSTTDQANILKQKIKLNCALIKALEQIIFILTNELQTI